MTAKTQPAATGEKFTIEHDAFQAALAAVQGAVQKETSIPVLTHLLIESLGDKNLRFTGTDLDITIRCDAEARVEGGVFAALVKARKLFEIAKALPNEPVTVEREENDWVRLSCGRTKYRLMGASCESYAEVPTLKATPVTLPGDQFRRLIRLTTFAITNEASRFTLSGAKLEIADGKLRMVTTDGHRLSFVEIPIETDQTVGVIIPKKALAEVAKLSADEIRFGADARHAYFTTDTQQIITRLLTGNFPNYEMVMPKDADQVITISCREFRSLVKRAAIMSDDRQQSIRLQLAKSSMQVTAETHEQGSFDEMLSAEFDGDQILFGYNWHYLMDFLTVAGDDQKVSLHFKDSNSQTEFRTEAEPGMRYVVMPLRI